MFQKFRIRAQGQCRRPSPSVNHRRRLWRTVNSMVTDIMMPLSDCSRRRRLQRALRAGRRQDARPIPASRPRRRQVRRRWNYGLFINAVISFAIIAVVLFMVIKGDERRQARRSGLLQRHLRHRE